MRVVAKSAGADVTAPQAQAIDVLCRVKVSPLGHRRTALFVAVGMGRAYIGATITGVPGGINHPAYGARVTVR